jgi:hypothetical protein
MSELIDNRAHRIRTLKHIIQHLHAGEAPEQVKAQLAALVKETDANEIAAMEQELIADGMPVAEVQSMCDLHSEVLRDFIVDRKPLPVPPGHPIDTFVLENRALQLVIDRVRRLHAEVAALPDEDPAEALRLRWRAALGELMDVEKHYQRKEHLLFPFLEAHGITGPSKVMWGKDDEVRALLKTLDEALSAPDAAEHLRAGELKLVAEAVSEPALRAAAEMIYKEENILLPMARETLTDDEWGQIWAQSPEVGWCLVEPRKGWTPPERTQPEKTVELPRDRAVVFPSGTLTFDQLRGLFAALPVDVTFVDADDRVRFFSEGAERIFPRSRAIIGRKVQHCHPPKSVDTVERIVADFREGRQDVAEFWIQLHGRFVHIRYFAVRDEERRYLGTLEVSQDLTPLRALEGERRLLEWDAPQSGEGADPPAAPERGGQEPRS